MSPAEDVTVGDRVAWTTRHGMRYGAVIEVGDGVAIVWSRGVALSIKLDRLFTAPGATKNGGVVR